MLSEIPLISTVRAMSKSVSEFIDEGLRRSKTIDCFDFVPSNYGVVYAALWARHRDTRATGGGLAQAVGGFRTFRHHRNGRLFRNTPQCGRLLHVLLAGTDAACGAAFPVRHPRSREAVDLPRCGRCPLQSQASHAAALRRPTPLVKDPNT